MNQNGRPTSYEADHADRAQMAYANGFTDEQVARLLGIHLSTLYRWREQHPDFAEATQSGKDDADARIQLAMYRRALGYTFHEIRTYRTIDPEKADHEQKTVEITAARYAHADPRVGMQWLRLRRPAEWRDPLAPPQPSSLQRLPSRKKEDANIVDRLDAALRNVAAGREPDDDGRG